MSAKYRVNHGQKHGHKALEDATHDDDLLPDQFNKIPQRLIPSCIVYCHKYKQFLASSWCLCPPGFPKMVRLQKSSHPGKLLRFNKISEIQLERKISLPSYCLNKSHGGKVWQRQAQIRLQGIENSLSFEVGLVGFSLVNCDPSLLRSQLAKRAMSAPSSTLTRHRELRSTTPSGFWCRFGRHRNFQLRFQEEKTKLKAMILCICTVKVELVQYSKQISLLASCRFTNFCHRSLKRCC